MSAQFVGYKDGTIEQWVDLGDAAWHAGNVRSPTPLGRSVLVPWENKIPQLPFEAMEVDGSTGLGTEYWVNPNLTTIGIEHQGRSGEPWTAEMYEADAFLVHLIRQQHPGAILLGHRDFDSLMRKNCPGTGVDLEEIERRAALL